MSVVLSWLWDRLDIMRRLMRSDIMAPGWTRWLPLARRLLEGKRCAGAPNQILHQSPLFEEETHNWLVCFFFLLVLKVA